MSSSTSSSSRLLRRHIRRALAGAALGVGILTVPALAIVPNTYNVTTKADDGSPGSLRNVITEVNADGTSDTVTFAPSLGANPVFILNSALPAITNSSGVTFDLTNVGTITLPQALTASNSGVINVKADGGTSGEPGDNTGTSNGPGNGANGTNGSGNSVTADVILNSSSSFTVKGGDGGNGGEAGYGGDGTTTDANGGAGGTGGVSSITGNLSASDSTFTLTGGAGGASGDKYYGGYGGYAANSTGDGNGGAGGAGGGSSIIGDVSATDSTFMLNGGAGGNGGGGGESGIAANSTGNALGGAGGAGGGSSINGNVSATNSTFTLNGGAGGNGGYAGIGGYIAANNGTGGAGGAGGNSYVQGNVTANGSTSFTLIGGAGGNGGDGLFSYGDGNADGGDGGKGGDSYIDGNVIANDSSTITLNGNGSAGNQGEPGSGNKFFFGGAGGVGGTTYINGDVTTNDQSIVTLENGSRITGNVITNDSSAFTLYGGTGGTAQYINGGAGSDSFIQGKVTANGFSSFTLIGGAGGNGGDGGNTGGTGGNTSITGNVTANDSSGFTLTGGTAGEGDGGTGGVGGNTSITGNVTANDSSGFTLTGGTGGAGFTGIGGVGGNTSIIGNVTANDSSGFTLTGGTAGEGVGATGGAGGGNTSITGNVTANDSSSFTLTGGTGGEANSGNGGVGGNNVITGNVTANGSSSFTLNGGTGGEGLYGLNVGGAGGNSVITGNVTTNGSSSFTLNGGTGGSSIEIPAGVGGDSFIVGNVTANDSSIFTLFGGNVGFGDSIYSTTGGAAGSAYITGNVAINDTAILRSQGLNTLNTTKNTTTSFGTNATYAPSINLNGTPNPDTANVLTVGNLSLSNSLLRPNWGDSSNTIAVGQSFDVLHYNGTDTGIFNPTVVSPFTFTTTYTGPSAGDVNLTLTGVDFTHVGGGTNQQALENYLNQFTQTSGGTITLDPNSKLPFNLGQLASDLSENGAAGLGTFLPTSGSQQYSQQNAQSYFSTTAFINSIADNLRNGNSMNGSPSSFALNLNSSVDGAGMQLASLRQATTSIPSALGYENNMGSNASNVWAAYTGSHQHTDANAGIGSNAWNSSSDGYTLGYTAGGDSFNWGVAAGHQQSTSGSGATTSQLDGYNGGLYAAWKSKSTYLNAVLGYGDYDNTINGAGGSTFKTSGLSGYVELGKQMKENHLSSLTPYVSLLWSRIKNGSGTGPGGFILQSATNNIYTTSLGLRYNHRMYDSGGTLTGGWQAGVAWLHQFGDTAFPVNGSFTVGGPTFPIQSTPLSGNAAQVQLGAYGRIHGSLIGFIGYQGTFGSNQTINSVNAGVGYQF